MRKNGNGVYTVYAHRNKENGKLYIGTTNVRLTQRFGNGKGYMKCTRFWEAIKKYGFSNFDHIVIADGLTKDQAMKMEETLIDLLGTMNPDIGYNMRRGGVHNIPCEEVKQKISKARMGHTVNPELIEKQKKLYGRAVIQLSIDGEFIFAYPSLKEAAKAVNGYSTNIFTACKGKQLTSYGFRWRFFDETDGEYNEKIEKAGLMQNEQCKDSFERALKKIELLNYDAD